MLSPTVSVLPPEGTPQPEQSTRRRGLTYLRSLSSHSSASNTDQPRSPRSFFQRSSSYNNESKSRPTTGRRRSASRPNEPTSIPAGRPVLTRVLSAGNSPIPSPIPFPPYEDNSSNEDIRQSRAQERTAETLQLPAESPEMARAPRPSTPRRVTESALSSAVENSKKQPASGGRVSSNSLSNGSSAATNSIGNGLSVTSKVSAEDDKPKLPTIRLFPHQDLRNNGRQSLNFSPISRTLPSENSIIRVGRYSEREGLPVANPTQPSDAPVGFKSKVVSRKHCEFSFVDGQWQIRDVASSSGTFLNHIRLSQPNQESRLFPIKDGDIVQLGIDFRGGEEMIFRCVKIRIECNRSWQKKPNNFNKVRQAQLLGLSKDQPAANQNSGECSICLGNVLPCQALFVAPCAHVWHYKCIRPMIEGRQSQYPSFQCPNCRAWSDLEADVDLAEEDMDAWMENGGDTDDHLDTEQTERPSGDQNMNGIGSATVNGETKTASPEGYPTVLETGESSVLAPNAVPVSLPSNKGLLSRRPGATSGVAEGSTVTGITLPARPKEEEIGQHLIQQQHQIDSPNSDNIIAGEGPLTPRNNAGPFVFDGSGGTGETRRRTLFIPGLREVTEHVQS